MLIIGVYIYIYIYVCVCVCDMSGCSEVSTASVAATNDTIRIEHWHYQPFEGLNQFET